MKSKILLFFSATILLFNLHSYVFAAGPILYNSGGNQQLCFDDSRINTTAPVFRVSSSPGFSIEYYQLEINTTSAFNGTSYNQNLTGPFTDNEQVNLKFDNPTPAFTPGNGQIFYVRVRAGSDLSTWGPWSTQTYIFTYDNTITFPDWKQSIQAQFSHDVSAAPVLLQANPTNISFIPINGGANPFANPSFENYGSCNNCYAILHDWSCSGSCPTPHTGYCNTNWYCCQTHGVTNGSVSFKVTDETWNGYCGNLPVNDKAFCSQNVDLTGVPNISFDYTFEDNGGPSGACSGPANIDVQLQLQIDGAVIQYVSNTCTNASGKTTRDVTKTLTAPISSYNYTGVHKVTICLFIENTHSSNSSSIPGYYIDNIQAISCYPPSGTYYSAPIELADFYNATNWKELKVDQKINAGSGIIYTLQKDDGSGNWSDIAGLESLSNATTGIKIFDISSTNDVRIRIKMTMTATCSNAPVLNNWIVSATYNICNPVTTVNISPAPSSVVCSGTPVTFTAVADGNQNMTYQWQLNNGSWKNITDGGSGPVYEGSETAILQISNASGIFPYRCIASNCAGANIATSNAATLTIIESPPTSNLKFINQTKYPGDNASYTLSPGGIGPFTYQWMKGGNDVPGETNSIFNLNSVECSDSGLYSCKISNMCYSITPKIVYIYVLNCSRFTYAILGNVNYNNKDSTPITNTIVKLSNMGDTIIDNNTTDANGYYVFVDYINDSYKLACSTTIPWGGSNPVDALLVNRSYIGVLPITNSLKKRAADVNNDNKINPIDALMINRRYIGLLDKFIDNNKVRLPDWLFSDPIVTVAGLNVTQNIIAICAGDVNASYTPPLRIMNYELGISNEEEVKVEINKAFDLPIYLNEAVDLGAIGLKFRVPGSMFQVIDVKSDLPGFIYNIIQSDESDKSYESSINVAWSAENSGLNNTPDKPVLYLKCILYSSNYLISNNLISISSESIIADIDANYISLDKVVIPKIVMSNLQYPISNLIFKTYPNPFSNITNINYTIPEDANINLSVYNVLGEKIACLIDDMQTAGLYNLQFNASSLREGVYYCVLQLTNRNLQLSKTNILFIAR